MANVAESIIETLAVAGVERIYGVAGDSLNALTEAIRKEPRLKWVPTRHEEAAAFAAGAEAHLTGSLAVCAGSCGPGHLHLMNGLYDCQRSGVPVLAIAAHIPSSEIGSGYFQETHPAALFQECSHYCELVSTSRQMPHVLRAALHHAQFKKGVAVLILPGDVALEETRAPAAAALKTPKPLVRPSDKELDALAELLNGHEKITLLGGRGCAGAHDELMALAQALQSPVVHALGGKEYIEYDNPYDVGMTGLIGFASGYHAMASCEALLMLGTDFPYRQFYPPRARIAQIDIRPEHLGKRAPLAMGLVGDIRATLSALLPRIRPKAPGRFLDAARKHYQEARKGLDDLARPSPGQPIHPQHLTKCVDEAAEYNAIFACDVGTPTVWAARYLKMNGKRRLLGSFAHGSMANALSQALGAQSCEPHRQVIALCGDGGLAMLMGELLSVLQLELPIKIVVYNNQSLGFVALEQKAAGYLDTGVELKNPNFAEVAQAIGIKGFRVDDPKGVSSALEEALAHPGAALVDVAINPQELILPPRIGLAEARGFGLFMLKAVLNGRGDEVVEILQSHLFR